MSLNLPVSTNPNWESWSVYEVFDFHCVRIQVVGTENYLPGHAASRTFDIDSVTVEGAVPTVDLTHMIVTNKALNAELLKEIRERRGK